MIVFVNGMANTREEAAESASLLSEVCGGKDVNLFYNPGETIFEDLWESFHNRFFSWLGPTKIVRQFVERIRWMRGRWPEDTIHLVGHSQGAMIILNGLKILSEYERIGVYAYLFASPKTRATVGVPVEYFVNRSDWVMSHVPGSSLLNSIRNKNLTVYERTGDGHGFDDYMSCLPEFSTSTKNYSRSAFHTMATRPEGD